MAFNHVNTQGHQKSEERLLLQSIALYAARIKSQCVHARALADDRERQAGSRHSIADDAMTMISMSLHTRSALINNPHSQPAHTPALADVLMAWYCRLSGPSTTWNLPSRPWVDFCLHHAAISILHHSTHSTLHAHWQGWAGVGAMDWRKALAPEAAQAERASSLRRM